MQTVYWNSENIAQVMYNFISCTVSVSLLGDVVRFYRPDFRLNHLNVFELDNWQFTRDSEKWRPMLWSKFLVL